MPFYRIPSPDTKTQNDQFDEVSKYLDSLHSTGKIRGYSIDRFGEDLLMYLDLIDPSSEREINRTFRQYSGRPTDTTRRPVAISGMIKSVGSEMVQRVECGESIVIHRSKVRSS